MTHSKSKLNTNEIQAFRKFLEARGFKCRDGKGDWQALQVQNIKDRGWKAFCFNTKGVVTSPVEFDALIQVFRAPVDPASTVKVIDRSASHDSDLLDDFAIAALPSVIELICGDRGPGDKALAKPIAECAYAIARAMMAERSHHQPK